MKQCDFDIVFIGEHVDFAIALSLNLTLPPFKDPDTFPGSINSTTEGHSAKSAKCEAGFAASPTKAKASVMSGLPEFELDCCGVYWIASRTAKSI